MDKGYVYILVNKSMPGLVKIGQTTKKPQERAKELSSSTGVPTPFEVAYSFRSSQYEKLEKEMHTALAKRRVNNSREFFEVSVNEAKTLLNKLASPIDRIPNFFRNVSPRRPQHPRNDIPVEKSNIIPEGEFMKVGLNGSPYHSAENGFDQAKNANGIPESVKDHINIIIDNEKLAINTDRELLEKKVRELSDEITNLKKEREDTEESLEKNQKALGENKLLSNKLKAACSLEMSIDEKTGGLNGKKTDLAQLQEDMTGLPSNGNTSIHRRPSRLYIFFYLGCCLLALGMYFFYISAIDKGFLSNLPTASESQDIEDIERYTQFNDIFDPSSVLRAIQNMNFWLIMSPFVPLALAFVIHPLWTYSEKYKQAGKKREANLCWLGFFMFIVITFVVDCILALQVSKKIHESKELFGLEEGDWSIVPIYPWTWDLNILLVLSFGFLASVLLSALFHFALEMQKEAQTQNVEKEIRIKKEVRGLETKLKGQEDAISTLQNRFKDVKDELKDRYDGIDVSALGAEVSKYESNIEHLTDRINKDNRRIESIQSEIKNKEGEIEDSNALIDKKAINVVKLRANAAEFLTGWTKFLAAAKRDAAEDVVKVQKIAEETLNKHFDV